MSRTMRDDAISHDTSACMARIETALPVEHTVLDPTMLGGDCPHLDLNHDGTRCLACGTWAHQFVKVS